MFRAARPSGMPHPSVSLAMRERHFAGTVDPEQFAFELVGIGTSFQQAHKLLNDPSAKARALRAIDRLIEDAPPKKRS